jgi:hypothetical protein
VNATTSLKIKHCRYPTNRMLKLHHVEGIVQFAAKEFWTFAQYWRGVLLVISGACVRL